MKIYKILTTQYIDQSINVGTMKSTDSHFGTKEKIN